MGPKEREIQRRLRVLEHAEKIGNVCLTCRYFGLARSTFYRWKTEYDKQGETGLDEIEHIGSLLESYISTAENENSNIASGITYFESEAADPGADVRNLGEIEFRDSPFCQGSHISALSASA